MTDNASYLALGIAIFGLACVVAGLGGLSRIAAGLRRAFLLGATRAQDAASNPDNAHRSGYWNFRVQKEPANERSRQ